MNTYYTKIVSNISRSKNDAEYLLVGSFHVRRIKAIRFIRSQDLFANKLEVKHCNGETYLIEQCDRDAFFIAGPHCDGIRVDGWADGVKLLNSL